ncbi:chorismate mutase [Treponema brennaborense DSM 12168]|uniref:chorismate mutase n=2 Tax=Treponema TaxID=157 RepID=F4LMP6_TREBD|nr:chorismate mutase [Treponema brennaborense DSM 12168]
MRALDVSMKPIYYSPMDKRLFGIRGAVCCENSEIEIERAVSSLCAAVFAENKLTEDDFVSIQFTVTPDLDALNPAAALRRGPCGALVRRAALFCSAEPVVAGSLPRVVRLLVTAYMDADRMPVHVYTGGAEVLRPDFVSGTDGN